MRYILSDNGYIESVSFSPIEYNGKTCKEYTGTVPSGYSSLEDWAVNANIAAYKIVSNNLVYDAAKDAEIGEIVAKTSPYHIYSTEEKLIGEWIDGKPLYRKMIEVTTPTNATPKTYDVSDLNIETAADVRGIIGNGRPVNFTIIFGDTGTVYFISCYYENNTIYLTSHSAYGGLNGKVIIEYTKTTD